MVVNIELFGKEAINVWRSTMTTENFFDIYRPETGAGLPKYQQLRFAMIEAIRSEHWPDGAKLPTEEELTAMTGFSLGTIQRAVRMLADDGLLSRRQGSGTFVSRRNARIQTPWHFQFLDDDGKTLLPVYPKVVARERTAQRGPWSRFLPEGDDKILRIDRIINVNDEFLAFSRFFVSGAQADLMEDAPVEELHGANFRVVLSHACRLPVTSIDHKVMVAPATADQASELRISKAEPLLRIEIAARSGGDHPLYFQELLCPPTRRKLHLPSIGRY